MKKIILSFSFLLLLFNTRAVSQVNSISHSVDAFLAEKIKEYQIPGIALAVIKNNVVLKKFVSGYNNLDSETPVTTKTVFAIASMEKQITATCIMMLYEQGKLKLTDNISSYIDSVPENWHKIQIRHLLSHTSGLPDEVAEYYKGRNLINYSTDEILAYIKKQELQFQPGDGFIYSDAGYVLLQLIVEKVSGKSYGDFLKQHILHPLGMKNSVSLDPTQVVKQRATSYYRNKEKKMFVNNFRQVDFGPLYNDLGCSIDDFIKYDNALTTFKLLKKETYALMWTPFTLNNGRLISNFIDEQSLFYASASYGYAWAIDKFKNHRIIYHGGFTGTCITKLPEDGLTVILFTNLIDRAGFNPEHFARQIASFYVPAGPSSLMAAKTDPHPDRTAHIKKQLLNIETGLIDSLSFSKEFFKPFSVALPAFRNRLKTYGSLQSLTFLDSDSNGMKTNIYYKAIYSNGKLFYRVSLIDNNLIDFITAER